MAYENEIKREIDLLNLQKTRLKNFKDRLKLEDESIDKAKKMLRINSLLRQNYREFQKTKTKLNFTDDEALQLSIDNKKQVKELVNLSDKLNNNLSTQLGISESIQDVYQMQAVGAKLINVSNGKNRDIRLEIQDIGKQILDNQDDIIKNDLDMLSGDSKKLGITKQLLDIELLKNEILDTYKLGHEELRDHLLMELELRKKALIVQQDAVKILERRNELIDEGTEQIKSTFDSITSGLNSLPGGGMLSKVLGIETFGKEFTKTIKDNLIAGESAFKGLGSTVSKSFGVIGKALTSTLGSVLGLAAIFAIFYSVLSGITEKVMETSKELGISTDQAKKLVDNSKEWAGQLAGGLATTEDILTAQSAIVKEYGTINNISKELVGNIATMEKVFGVAGETTAKVTKSLEGMGISKNAIATANILAGGLAEAAGVPIGAVMEDVAQSSEMIHKFLPKYAPDIYKAAIEAKRLGLTLNEIGQVGEKLLDVQSSLESEMVAQVMLGKQINFDKSRQLFANKEPLKAIDVLMRGIGDITDLNVFKQQAITEATGLTVDQIAEYQRKQKEINELKGDELRRYNEATTALEKLNEDQAKSLAHQQEANLAAAKLKAQWDSIKQSLIKAIQPLAEIMLPVLGWIGDAIQFIAKHTYLIQAAFIVMGTIWLSKILKPILGTMTALKKLGGLAKRVFSRIIAQKAEAMGGGLIDEGGGRFRDKLTGRFAKGPKGPKTPTADTGSKPSKMMQGLTKIDWKKMLAGAAAMVLVAAAVWIMAKAMQEFSTGVTWDGVLKGIVAMGALTLAILALGIIMSSGYGTLMILAGAAAMLIMAGAMWVLGKALQEIAVGVDAVVPALKSLSGLGGGLISAAAGIMAISLAMASFAGASILGVIGSIFSEVGMVRTLTKLSDLAPGLNSVAESLNSIKASMDSLNGTKADISISTNKAETIGIEGQKVTSQEQNIPVATTTTGPDGLGRIASLIEQLIMSVNQPQVIHIGNKVITEITRQQTLSRHRAAGFDNRYGYAVQ